MADARARNVTEQIAFWVLIVAVAGAPLPFGSREATTVAVWCGLLGIGVACAPVARLRRPHHRLLAGLCVLLLAYAIVIHEQIAATPWFASYHPVWAEAGSLSRSEVRPAVAVVRDEPLFALGAPLANLLVLILGLVVGADRNDARRALRVMAWAGVASAVYGIASLAIDPTAILWREKTVYVGNLTGTFINRNTAATYFGSCTVVWFLFLLDGLRRRLPAGPVDRARLLGMLGSGTLTSGTGTDRTEILVPALAAFVCLTATFLTTSRAGTALTLLMLALAFVIFFRRRISGPRRLLVVAVGLALAVALLLWLFGGTVGSRFDAHGLTDEGRLSAWRSTLQMIADHPWLGTGLGTFTWAFPAYRGSDITLWGVWNAAHSTPLELAAELGLPLAGLIAIGWLVGLVVLARGSVLRRRDRLVPLAGLCVALLGLSHSAIDFSLQVTGYAIVMFGVVGVGLAQAFTPPDASADRIAGAAARSNVNPRSAATVVAPDRAFAPAATGAEAGRGEKSPGSS